jgi:hypothetical protein
MTAMTRPAGAPAGSDSAKYDLNKNPIYQIDMTTASTGKLVAQSKRRVRWRFGFSNKEAIAGGGTGTDCRGEEHEVILIWSLTSGKRLVLMDGKEVHFSMGKPTSGKFQTSWTMRGNHVLKLVAYAAPPVRNRPGFRQYELFLDGMSFFSFPRIYELGVGAGGGHARGLVRYEGGGSGARSSAVDGRQPYSNYSLPAEEENAWARRVDAYETQRGMDSVPAEVRTAPTTAASSTDDLVNAALGAPGQDIMDQPAALLDTSVPTMAPPQPEFDEFTPQAAPAPTYNDVAGSVLNLYGPTEAPAQQQQLAVPALPFSTSAPVEQQQQYYAQPPAQQQQQQHYYQEPAAQQFAATPQLVQQQQQQYHQEPPVQQPQYYQEQQQYMYATPTKEENPEAAIVPADASPTGVDDLDDVTKALKSLVNFDDINEKPVDEKLSMYSNPFEHKNHLREDQRVHKKGAAKSRGLTATANDHGMAGRSLAEVKHLHGDGVRKLPAKEVMKTHAFDPAAAQAGMMVVYGTSAPPQQQHPQAYGNYSMPGQPAQQPHNYLQGPPPIGPSAGTGFGIGSMLPGGGYGAPQQQAHAMR